MSNIYQKLYKTSRRENATSDQYAFITYRDESDMYSIVKFNRVLEVDTNNNGIIKDAKGSYRVQIVEKGKVLIDCLTLIISSSFRNTCANGRSSQTH